MTKTVSHNALVAEQTEIRRALLRNGYSPFPCAGKNKQMWGWPDIEATEDLIDEWAGQKKWVSTAVHAGKGGLVGIDVDIDDADVLDDFIDRLPEDLWARLRHAPVRYGGGFKEMWLCRFDEKEQTRAHAEKSGKWGDMEAGEDAPDHKLEIWLRHKKLLALYGAREVDGREITSWYEWRDGRGPHNVPLADLPVIGNEDVSTLLRCAVEAMQAAGWERLDVNAPEENAGDKVYDLTSDMSFTLRNGDVVSLDELTEMCEASDDVRLYSWLPGKRRRGDRCAAKINGHDGRLQIYDYDTEVLHRPVDNKPLRDSVQALAERLYDFNVAGAVTEKGENTETTAAVPKDRLQALKDAVPEGSRFFGGVSLEEGGGGEDDAEEARREQIVADVLGRYAYWSDGRGYVVDIQGGPENAMTLGSFQTKLAPLSWMEKPAKGPMKKVNPADVWKEHPERAEVAGFRFLPDCTDRVAVRGDKVFINIWERPPHWGAGGAGNEKAVSAFQKFLEHLIPDESERGWFMMWLAAKTQKPWLPNCGVIMVAERQGTGRGTLFDMLRGVFGARHVNNVAAVQLIGGGSQAQYTDWIERALLVTCDEVLAGDDAGGAMAWKRREVYERLKSLIDPRPRPMNIVRKGLPSNEAEVFASFLLATNNANALPLSADDRRIAVVSNTATPLAEVKDVMNVLAPWRDETLGFSEVFSAGLFAWLRQQEVDWEAVREAPRWMRGREDMLAANETDLDEVLENVLRRVEGDFVLGHHLRERLGRSIEANGLDGEIKGWWNKALDILARPNRLGWRRLPGRHRFAAPKEQGNMTVTSVFYRCEGPGAAAWNATEPSERPALWRGGDPSVRAAGESLAQRMIEKGLKTV